MGTNEYSVPEASRQEEIRQLAVTITDLRSVVAVIIENRLELLPGEAADELAAAWNRSETSFNRLAQDVYSLSNPLPPSKAAARSSSPDTHRTITEATLEEHQLLGPVGFAKRSLIARLKDAFYAYWNSLPRTDDKRIKAAHAAMDLCEGGASVAGSIGGAVGGAVEEALLLIKQALSMRLRRGH